MKYEIELRIFSKEDRRTVAAILSDNGYDVGQHTKKSREDGPVYRLLYPRHGYQEGGNPE